MLIIDQLKKGDRPLRLLALGVLIGLGVLLLGLFYVQVISGKRYQASQVSQSFRTIRIPAIRGRILDTGGTALAENRPCYSVNLYLEELRPAFQQAYTQRSQGRRLSRAERDQLGREVRYAVASNLVLQAAAALRQPLQLDAERFHEHYDQRKALPLSVAADLTLEQVGRFVELGASLPGLELEMQPVRAYPHGPLAAHLLGYLRRNDRPHEEDLFTRYSLPDYSGVIGIEGTFDRTLRGVAGVKSVLVNNLGYRQSENTWVEAAPGDNVVLTLDQGLQRAADEALRSVGPGTRGAVVVMDSETGDLLALVSQPTFDPNRFLPRLSAEDWAQLQDPRLLPMLNRATYGTYPPGSVFKIVVGLAALESGILDPEKVYHSPGYYLLGRSGHGRRIRDTANGGQPASFDFKKALKQSSNAYFIHYGLLTGLDDIVTMGQRLHFGEKTGLPLGQESPGVFPTPAWREHELGETWFEGHTANLAIGQGYITVTPVQVAVMTAAVANGGRVLWPRLVARIAPPDPARAGETIEFTPGRIRNQLGVSARNLRLVREAMLADVEDDDGTGRKARVEGLRICAKTGTAQLRRSGGGIDHITWFTSFAPFERPRYAVVVMIESGASGGETCGRVARKVYEAILARNRATPAMAARHP